MSSGCGGVKRGACRFSERFGGVGLGFAVSVGSAISQHFWYFFDQKLSTL
jgi:hypothetical protein